MTINTRPMPYTNDETLSMFVTHLIELGNRCNRSLMMLDPKIGVFKTWSSGINNFINEFYEMSFGNHDEFLVGLDIETWPKMLPDEEVIIELDCIPAIEVEKVDEYISHFATLDASLDMNEYEKSEYFGLLWNISLGEIAKKIDQLDIFDERKTFLFIRELLAFFESGDEHFSNINVITTQRSETYEKSIKLDGRFHKDSVFFIAKDFSSTSHNSVQIFDSLFDDMN